MNMKGEKKYQYILTLEQLYCILEEIPLDIRIDLSRYIRGRRENYKESNSKNPVYM